MGRVSWPLREVRDGLWAHCIQRGGIGPYRDLQSELKQSTESAARPLYMSLRRNSECMLLCRILCL